jgi:hypothetical protein
MRRGVVAFTRLGSLARSAGILSALSLVACVGDDTNPPSPDAGVTDATVSSDGSGGDSASASASDAGVDGGECVPYDAAGLSDAEIQAGKAIVLQSKCGKCHGQELQGNQNGVPSTTAEGGIAYPPDLTPDPIMGLGCWTNQQIANAFLYGIDNQGALLCNPMPHFSELADGGISEAGAAAVVAYLRSIPAISTNVPSTGDCPVPTPTDGGEPDGGPDAAPDAAPDGSLLDAGHDGAVPDAAPDGSLLDAGPDGSVSDAGADVELDGTAADGASDAADEAASDGGLDAD